MPEPKERAATGGNAFLARIALGSLADMPIEIRNQLLATIIQSPVTMVVTSTGLISTCAATVFITGKVWAWTWLVVMLLFLAWRAALPFCKIPADRLPKIVIMGTMAMFSVFGMGCAFCFATGDRVLSVTAAGSVLGSAAGLASRWAAIPRLAIAIMALTSLPLAAAMFSPGGLSTLLGVQLALVLVSLGTMAVHNHANLVRMIQSEHANQKLALTDSLTGLSNRSHLNDNLERVCQSLQHDEKRKFALLYLDLDGFKAVNDQHGHEAGDRLLCDVSQELSFLAGSGDTVARIGGDEFIVIIDNADEQGAILIAQRIIQRVTRDYRLETGHLAPVGCSIGIALAPEHGQTPAVLISRADMALYSVKRKGKGTFAVWSDSETQACAA
jgi:diguanylate cyclase